MNNMKILYVFLVLYLSTNFVYSQSIEELTERANKYNVIKKSKYLGDTLKVVQIIKDIEHSFNQFNSDQILFYFTNKKEKISKRKEALSDKKLLLSDSFSMLNSKYKNIEKEKMLIISNLGLILGDTIIIANVGMQLIGNNNILNKSNDEILIDENIISYTEDIDIQTVENGSNLGKQIDNQKTENIINDKWVFKKIYGQWKLVSCDNFMYILNNLATN